MGRDTLADRIDNLEFPRRFTVMLYPPPHEYLDHKYMYRRYKLPQWRYRNDAVFSKMVGVIRDLNREDMCFASVGMRVFHLNDGPALWPSSPANTWAPVKLYAFKEGKEEFPKTIPVMVSPGVGPLAADRIKIQVKGSWVTLTTWLLDHVTDREEMTTGLEGVRTQRHWWARNGKHFPSMELPAEVRGILLRHILGDRIQPLVRGLGWNDEHNEFSQVVLGKEVRGRLFGFWDRSQRELYRLFDTDFPDTTPINFAILRLNKQIFGEALETGWQGTRKIFREVLPFETALTKVTGIHLRYNWLCKIQLEFSVEGYLVLAGFHVDDTATPPLTIRRDRRSSKRFRESTSLRDLELTFPDPYYRRGSHYSVGSPSHNLWWAWTRASGRRDGCYNILVDWILTLLFPDIKHIGIIRLTGCIKSSLKHKWDAIFTDDYNSRNDEVRTDGYNHQEDLYKILSFPVNRFPPECRCPASCSGGAKRRVKTSAAQDMNGMPCSYELVPIEFDIDDTFVPDEELSSDQES